MTAGLGTGRSPVMTMRSMVAGRLLLLIFSLGASEGGTESCRAPRLAPGPGCQRGARHQVLCVPVWPPGSEGGLQLNVTVLLPDTFWSGNQKRCVPEHETRLQASYKRVGPAILAGLEEAARRGWVPGISFNIEFIDTKCDNSFAPKAWEELLITGLPAHVLFGPACDYALAAVARQIKHRKMPLITAGGYALDFSEKKTNRNDEYYLLTRTGQAWTGMAKTFLNFVKQNEWGRYVLVYYKNDHQDWNGDSSCFQLASAVSKQTNLNGKIVEFMPLDNLESFYYKPDGNNTSLDLRQYALQQNMTMLSEVLPAKNCSVILTCASPQRVRSLVLAANRLGMVDSGQYVFFNMENTQNLETFKPWYDPEAPEAENEELAVAFRSVLTVNLGNPHSTGGSRVVRRVKEVARQQFSYNFAPDEDVSTLAENFYDAALVYSKAVNETLMEGGRSMTSLKDYGEVLTSKMIRMNITGATGPVLMNSNRDRLTNYAIMALSQTSGKYEVAYTFSTTEEASPVVRKLVDGENCSRQEEYLKNNNSCSGIKFDTEDHLVAVPGVNIMWPGSCENEIYLAMQTKIRGSCTAGRFPPPDFPYCGMEGENCLEKIKEKDTVTLVISIVLSVVLVAVVIGGYFVHRHYREESEIARMNWKIDPSDVIRTKGHQGRFGSKMSVLSSRDSLGIEDSKKQMFVETVHYKGNVVAMKNISVENVNLNRALLLELKQMKDLHHDHLTRFLGACLESEPGCSFMITEYCPRGSLQDILEDSDFELDMDFRISLINDIVRAMAFLHASEIRFHGNLKSSNCVVDSRFVLKLTDFGLHKLRGCGPGERYSHQYYRARLWTAPELLRADPTLFSQPPMKKISTSQMEPTRGLLQRHSPVVGTPKADVYAFGIILHEILVRLGTWGTDVDYRSPEEIVGEVLRSGSRPNVDERTIDPAMLTIMRRSWAEFPNERIDFIGIKQELRRVNKDSGGSNILDNLLSRMERYADNLETAVKERTQDYLEEKKKCEDLLYELLPKSVASRLIQGQHVVAETFQSVTIYFSDIVGFTALSSSSSPLEVVDMLNDLYTLFDNIIPLFDVYKVETIGDAYMVVSGLPIRNGQDHAREICRMSLRILEAVKTFKIRHKPEEQLKIRIGLHTGPCCAGVVGIKMPRYCLFGDTVNTSSRMESNGLPLKIHLSETTQAALLAWGTFVLKLRGEVEMKGKGKMKTYWLLGETTTSLTDSNANLPLPEPAVNPLKLVPPACAPRLLELP